jgi:O-antigen/teichoic acid export membrane protein
LGLGFIIAGLGVQHQALLNRQMRFLALGVVEIVSNVTGIAAGITSALWGAGYWSLVILNLVTAVTRVACKWIALSWIPGLRSAVQGFDRCWDLAAISPRSPS